MIGKVSHQRMDIKLKYLRRIILLGTKDMSKNNSNKKDKNKVKKEKISQSVADFIKENGQKGLHVGRKCARISLSP